MGHWNLTFTAVRASADILYSILTTPPSHLIPSSSSLRYFTCYCEYSCHCQNSSEETGYLTQFNVLSLLRCSGWLRREENNKAGGIGPRWASHCRERMVVSARNGSWLRVVDPYTKLVPFLFVVAVGLGLFCLFLL